MVGACTAQHHLLQASQLPWREPSRGFNFNFGGLGKGLNIDKIAEDFKVSVCCITLYITVSMYVLVAVYQRSSGVACSKIPTLPNCVSCLYLSVTHFSFSLCCTCVLGAACNAKLAFAMTKGTVSFCHQAQKYAAKLYFGAAVQANLDQRRSSCGCSGSCCCGAFQRSRGCARGAGCCSCRKLPGQEVTLCKGSRPDCGPDQVCLL